MNKTDSEQVIEDILTESLNQSNIYKKKLEFLNNKYTFDELKLVTRRIWYAEDTIKFFINKNISLKGKITNLVEPHKQKMKQLYIVII